MMSLQGRRCADSRALVMRLPLLVLSVVVWRDAAAPMVSATYAIGTAVMLKFVAMALAALGLGHIVVAFRGGLPV